MELLTVSNAAARLRRSEGTVRRWADSGRLKTFVRLADGSRLFRERDVLSLLDHNPEDCKDEQATSPARSFRHACSTEATTVSVTMLVGSTETTAAPIDADRLPTEIRESTRAVVWKSEMRNGKPTKTPYVATAPHRHAKTNRPGTWRPFSLAMDAVRNGHADGVGIVLAEGIAGVDLDDCRDPQTGVIAPWAQQIIDDLNSYTEISPSKTGVKTWVKVDPKLSLKGRNHHRPDGSAIEMYIGGKYFTVTSDHLSGTPRTIEERTEEFVRLHKQISSRDDRKWSDLPQRQPVDLDDDALLEKAKRAKNGKRFSALWGGDTSLHGGDHSAADLALGSMLAFWTGMDAGRMDRLFRRSGLFRAKWDERRGDGTYGEMTIAKAIAACRDTYSSSKTRPTARGKRTTSSTSAEASAEAVTLEDFHAYMPNHNYIFVPTGQMWPASSVNARITAVRYVGDDGAVRVSDEQPSAWLDRHRAVEQMTWAPGRPAVIRDELVSDGGWMPRPGCSCFNLYRPPLVQPGDSRSAGRWLDHLFRIYPHDAHHILRWLAQRVQRPDEKINHALVLGGMQGVGKDTILEPVRHAVGLWNFVEVSPVQLLGRFNGFVKSVILRVSEARDLGDVNRYAFYDHTKTYTAAPPDVLRVDEKNLREYVVANVCGMVITTNYKTDGLYLPADDRRHYVAWSDLTKNDFPAKYWADLYGWYASGGNGHVAAYLAEYDLASFDSKAPPPKTSAFWDVVDANRAPEDAELADVLDKLGNPKVTTLIAMASSAGHEFRQWLRDRRNARQVPHRMDTAGYVPVRNPDATDGLWRVESRRQVIYVRRELSPRDRLAVAQQLMKGDR